MHGARGAAIINERGGARGAPRSPGVGAASDPVYLLGIAGMALIVAAWLVTLPREPPPLRLSAVYFAGSLLLTLYAVLRGDPVFTALNALAAVLSLANAVRALRARGINPGRAAAHPGRR